MDLFRLKVFCALAELGGFSKAAVALNVSSSKISRDIKLLEDDLGVQLVLRTTRKVEITPIGRKLFDHCSANFKTLESQISELLQERNKLQGTVRITAPEDIGIHLLGSAIAKFSRLHSDVRIDMIYTDKVLDYVSEGIDLGIRVSKPTQKSLRIQKLADISFILAGKRGQHSPVAEPVHLMGERFICNGPRRRDNQVTFINGGTSQTVNFKVVSSSGSFLAIREQVLLGAGAAVLPEFLTTQAPFRSQIIDLCPGWRPPSRPLFLVTHDQQKSAAPVRVFREFLKQEFAQGKTPSRF